MRSSEVNAYTPDFHTINISNVIIEDCRRLVHAIGLPERPLRNVLMRNIRGHAQEFMRLRDIHSFVLDDVDVQVNNDEVRIDGCEGIMLINTKVNGEKPKNMKHEGERTTAVITN